MRGKEKAMADWEHVDFSSMSGRIGEAYKIAVEAHKGQKDKAGADYILHPMTVASKVGDDESAIIVALLHDVVEDTNVTFEDLQELLTSEELTALKLLTHNDEVPYLDYVRLIGENTLTTKVKLADLQNNMDLSRLPVVTEKDLKRVEKYKKAFELLSKNDLSKSPVYHDNHLTHNKSRVNL